MAREYLVDEFICDDCGYTLDEQVDKKVSLLYDLCVLHRNGKNKDAREQAVRGLLASCKSEKQIDNAVHDVVMGNYTLNELLKRKGYLQ